MSSMTMLNSFDIGGKIASGPPSVVSTSSQRAPEYSAEEWEEQRERFTTLYQTPGLRLAQIQGIMKEKYRFHATLRQWKRKIKLWSLERNIKAAEGQFMVSLEAKRKHEEGKNTKFVVNGREVSEAKFSRIRRKLFKSILFGASIRTPANISYYTPRGDPSDHVPPQRRLSQQSSRHSHHIECFLCQKNIYGSEHNILQIFQVHVRSEHPGKDVLRCLEGFDVGTQVPGTVRTTRQLPSNHCGYVHGVETQRDGEEDVLVPIRLGRLSHVEDEVGNTRPYLSLTHAASCLTLRTEPRTDAHSEAMNQFLPQDMPFSTIDEQGDFEISGFAWTDFVEEPDAYFNQLHIPTADGTTFFEDWTWDDDWKSHWKADDGLTTVAF
ncbi:MAG: hypothetical protein GOMPHAMPRED_007666 [Gomphillus americanus]|uniref:Clr5 domain-containing protein n=1 Tax=Gomphillus americanus TaxID=1940652 RepID=A0A8H3EUA8_9LECA|nr:MAG: hypothetical protein GOMPHAMPRED_007666 [Gomphillus americanus]